MGTFSMVIRREAIVKAALASVSEPLPEGTGHTGGLYRSIATGNANAPARGDANARAGAVPARDSCMLCCANVQQHALEDISARQPQRQSVTRHERATTDQDDSSREPCSDRRVNDIDHKLRPNMKRNVGVVSTIIMLFLGGCAGMTTTEQRTLSGAGIGALGGAAIGALSGGRVGTGAAVGAAVGAGAGYLYDQKRRRDR